MANALTSNRVKLPLIVIFLAASLIFGLVITSQGETPIADAVTTDTLNSSYPADNVLGDIDPEIEDTLTNFVDLQVVKDNGPDALEEGDTLTYTIQVSNQGDTDATEVTLVDSLPSQVTFVSSDPNDSTCAYDDVEHKVACDLGTVTSGDGVTVNITVTVNAGASGAAGNTISNTVEVSGAEDDALIDNNSNAEDTLVVPPGHFGEIQGHKWLDQNFNGVRDDGEPPVEGVEICLYEESLPEESEGGVALAIYSYDRGALLECAETDINGEHRFTDLLPGVYIVEETPQPGMIQTYPQHGEGY